MAGRDSYCSRAWPYKSLGWWTFTHSCRWATHPPLPASTPPSPPPPHPASTILVRPWPPSGTMPPNLTGYYRFVSQQNLEDYLKALGNCSHSWLALALTPPSP